MHANIADKGQAPAATTVARLFRNLHGRVPGKG